MTRFKTTNTSIRGLPADFNQFCVGFDQLFEDLLGARRQTKYPPHSIYAIDPEKGEYCIEMAVAGFKKSELTIHLAQDNSLTVEGKKEEKEEKNYIHQGLSSRAFKKTFALNKDLEVNRSTCEDGILKIFLKNIPHKDDKVIEIE